MNIKTNHPHRLPIKHLEFKNLVSLLGSSREAVARLDEKLHQEKKAKEILEPLYWQEAISSLRAHPIRSIFREVISAQFAGLISGKKAALVEKIMGTKEALDLAVRWDSKRKIGHQFFCRIHRAIKSNPTNSKDNGRIRNRQNWIGPEGCKIEKAYFYPPVAAEVRPLLSNLEAYLAKQDLEPLIQLAIAFAQFLIIHPFMNGNGRVARILIPTYAYRKELLIEPALFLSEYFEAHRSDYFQKLFNISEKNNWEDWIAFFLTGVISQANRTRHRVDCLAKLWHQTAELSDENRANFLFRQPLIHFEQKFLIARGKECFFFDSLLRTMKRLF